jgi:integrase
MGVKVREKDGKWYVFINHHGQRKAKCVGDSKKAAEDVKRKLEAKLTLGDVGLLDAAPQAVSFGDYAEQWLAHYVPVACKPSSGRIMRGIVRNHLLPAFGAQQLQGITRTQVKTFVAHKHQRYTPTYVRHLVRILHTILAQAVDEEILDRNPAAKLGRGLPEQRSTPRRDIHPFTSAELAYYLATVHAHYPQHYPYFLCLARTGMREGEALGLYWDDVQVGQDAQDPHRFLHIQRTYDPVHRLFNTPKNGRSRRVDMSQELRRALLDLRHQRFDTAVLHGATTIPQVVFCGTEGRPLSAAGLYKIHQRVCARAGLRGNRIHDLRHSYATIQLYEYHAPIQYVSEQLGHASIKITVDIYGHPRQETSIALADRLDSAAGTALGWNARQSATSAQPQKTCRAKSIEISNG